MWKLACKVWVIFRIDYIKYGSVVCRLIMMIEFCLLLQDASGLNVLDCRFTLTTFKVILRTV
jgi:hypothetical protein